MIRKTSMLSLVTLAFNQKSLAQQEVENLFKNDSNSTIASTQEYNNHAYF